MTWTRSPQRSVLESKGVLADLTPCLTQMTGGLSCQAGKIPVPLNGDFASSQRLQGSCSLLLPLFHIFLGFLTYLFRHFVFVLRRQRKEKLTF